MSGGPGRDRVDGELGADHASGGGGRDTCVTDPTDDASGDC